MLFRHARQFTQKCIALASTAAALLLLLMPGKCLAIDNLTILLSEDGAAYTEFAASLGSLLAQGNAAKTSVKIISLATFKHEDLPRNANNQLLIAVGTPAMTAMAQKPPAMSVLNVLVTHNAFQKIARQYGRNQDPHHFSAIYFDQPWHRQLALIKAALPNRNRIGLLSSKETADLLPGLAAAAKEAELQINMETVNEDAELLPSLRKLLNNSDVLLAVPDAAIYNRNNIPSILLNSYRQKVPLFGFSASYVKAGALAAVFSTASQISQQATEIIASLPAHGYLPLPQYPRYFTVNVNAQVNRSLSLDVEDESNLMRKLKPATERAP